MLFLLIAINAILASFDLLVAYTYRRDLLSFMKRSFKKAQYFAPTAPDTDVIDAVLRYSISGKGEKMIMDEHRGLFYDIKNVFKKQRGSGITNNFFEAYTYVALSYLLMKNKDKALFNYLLIKADSFLSDEKDLCYQISIIDQIPIGIFYINMYKLTGNSSYMQVVNRIFHLTKSFCDDRGIISYRNNGKQYVDALGMYVPFLMEFYDLCQDKLAIDIVRSNIEYYNQYGVDKFTGLPFHGFEDASKMKIGSANWGRGIGWYAFAMSFCPSSMFDMTRFNNAVMNMQYTQFPGSSKHFDSSVALMVENYKASRGLFGNEAKSLSFIKSSVRKCGIVDFFSGDTYSFNDYSHSFGCSELGNAFLLMLVSRFN